MVTKRPCNARMSDGDKPGTPGRKWEGLSATQRASDVSAAGAQVSAGEKMMCRGATGNPAKPVVERVRKAAGKGRRSCSRTLLSCSLERRGGGRGGWGVCDGGHARYSRHYRDDRRA